MLDGLGQLKVKAMAGSLVTHRALHADQPSLDAGTTVAEAYTLEPQVAVLRLQIVVVVVVLFVLLIVIIVVLLISVLVSIVVIVVFIIIVVIVVVVVVTVPASALRAVGTAEHECGELTPV